MALVLLVFSLNQDDKGTLGLKQLTPIRPRAFRMGTQD